MTRVERSHELASRFQNDIGRALANSDFRDPLELVATILSAQCPTSVSISSPSGSSDAAERERLRGDFSGRAGTNHPLRPAFIGTRRRAFVRMARRLVVDHHGRVPDSLEALTTLPGVGHKPPTSSLGNAFGIEEGVVADIARYARRRAPWSHEPVRSGKIEEDFDEVVSPQRLDSAQPLADLARLAALLCAKQPDCVHCELLDICPTGAKLLKVKSS